MFLLPIKLDRMSSETKGRQICKNRRFCNIVYTLFALLFRHVGFLLLAPPPLGIRQQSRSSLSMSTAHG